MAALGRFWGLGGGDLGETLGSGGPRLKAAGRSIASSQRWADFGGDPSERFGSTFALIGEDAVPDGFGVRGLAEPFQAGAVEARGCGGLAHGRFSKCQRRVDPAVVHMADLVKVASLHRAEERNMVVGFAAPDGAGTTGDDRG